MNDGQVWRKLLQHGHRRSLVVNEDASLAARRNLASQDQAAFFGVDPVRLKHRVDGGRFRLEHRRYGCFIRAVADRVAGRLVAQQQRERVDEDGFTSAGFAGQEVETGRELHGHVVDDRVVFDPQFQEHVSVRGVELSAVYVSN